LVESRPWRDSWSVSAPRPQDQNKSNVAAPPVPKDWEAQTRKLLALLRERYPEMPPFEMREVEMSLCEYDKYVRLLLGEGKSKRGCRAA
jgi:hypothetical protein